MALLAATRRGFPASIYSGGFFDTKGTKLKQKIAKEIHFYFVSLCFLFVTFVLRNQRWKEPLRSD